MPRSNTPTDTAAPEASPPESAAGLSAADLAAQALAAEAKAKADTEEAARQEAEAAEVHAWHAAAEAERVERAAERAATAETARRKDLLRGAQATMIALAEALKPLLDTDPAMAAEDALIRLGENAQFGHDYPAPVASALAELSAALRSARLARIQAAEAPPTPSVSVPPGGVINPFAGPGTLGRDPRQPQV